VEAQPGERGRRLRAEAWCWCGAVVGILLVGLWWGGNPAQAQVEIPATKRPSVGIALGGGSSWGFAHLGVLQWLEENRIPIDYVAGTSMGGLIGGAYATGMSPAEIQEMIATFDWDTAFLGRAPYREKSFRRKEDQRAFPVNFEVGLRGGFRLPAGLDPVHPVGMLLSRIALPYSALGDFDALPIPFRCVATDMEKAEQVVLHDGSLAEAMRATMAIPGVFTPVERNGRILADGGLLNNVPADVVKAMGAEVVLAVDVGTELNDRTTFDSLTGMAAQAISVMIYHRSRQIAQLADLVIAPEILALPSKDFRQSAALARQGYLAAEARGRFLRTLQLDEEAWQAHKMARELRRRRSPVIPAFVTVEVLGASPTPNGRLGLTIPIGRPLDLAALEQGLTRVTGEGHYESLQYEMRTVEGREGLFIRAKEKGYGPPFLKFGLDINNARFGNPEMTLGARLTLMDVGRPRAELRIDLGVGSTQRMAAEYFRPLGQTRAFVSTRAFYDRGLRDLFEGETKLADYRIRKTGVGIDLGYQFGLTHELRAGIETLRVNARGRVGLPRFEPVVGSANVARIRYAYDGLNQAVVPTEGTTVTSEARWYAQGSAEGLLVPSAEVRTGSFHSFSPRDVGFLLTSGGVSRRTISGRLAPFTLGGTLRLGAFHLDELAGRHYAYLSPGYLRQVGRLPDFVGGKAYWASWIEHGSAFDVFSKAVWRSNLSTGFVLDTRLGPLFVGGSWGEGGRTKVYFAIGRLFR
jgi:NTE family protein